ncbi:MAG: hypothetical protein CVU36_22735 [Betaproteobacteria bacterium HGW-Betaproteobacteria-9]|jgi:hypothetical protein|nr:MAG: hypothetical protein CVU36_22735 [Betaproteobacteria bacterium HGW-Betaproteobacteria-9]
MQSVLYLFPDTNVFLQCKPLEQVTWETFGRWERINIVVTRPIQTEIDSLKGKGNSRQASKARAATSLLRRLLEDESPFIVLSVKPLVHLSVRLDLRTDDSASESLNYEVRDDQLVGTALAFQREHSADVTRLLTDDTGVMFSAKTVGVEYVRIPQDWFLPPEIDEATKRENALREKLASHEKSEPQFTINLSATVPGPKSAAPEHTSYTGSNATTTTWPEGSLAPYTATIRTYIPLTESELVALEARLVERFPLATEFGSSESQERPIAGGALSKALYGRFKEVFTPASSEQIETYKSAYCDWIVKCKELLKTYHETLNSQVKWPLLIARIANCGSRPADDALVVIEALGKPKLLRPLEEEEERTEVTFQLHPPPRAPTGSWKKVHLSGGLNGLDRRLGVFSSPLSAPVLYHPFLPPEPTDPNAFYWKEAYSRYPTNKLELACTQWRHAVEPEEFRQFVICSLTPGKHSGPITVTVHAANLTTPKKVKLSVELFVEQVSCSELATGLVEALQLPTKQLRLNLIDDGSA